MSTLARRHLHAPYIEFSDTMIEQTIDNDIVTLTLSHGKANAADLEMLNGLSQTLSELADARAVILTAGGSMFSAGVDLARMLKGGLDYAAEFVPLLDRVIREIFAFPAPLITAVNGHAIAGGCMFAVAGDYRIMARGKGRIGAPELMVSVPFPIAPLELMRFAVPRQHLQNHLYTGETLLADDAVTKGFVDEACDADQLMERAQRMAKKLAAIDGKNFRLAKSMLRDESLQRMLNGAERLNPAVFARWAEQDTLDGIQRYMDKLAGG